MFVLIGKILKLNMFLKFKKHAPSDIKYKAMPFTRNNKINHIDRQKDWVERGQNVEGKFNFVTLKMSDILCWNVYVACFLPCTVSKLSHPILQLGIKSMTFPKSA